MSSDEAPELAGETVWNRPEHRPRERTPPRSRKELARAAIALADQHGSGALTMRRLAEETGIATMSLYSYVKNKRELIDLVGDEMCAEIVLEEVPDGWRDALSAISRRAYRWFLAHPWLVEYMDAPDPVAGPNMLRHMDQSLQAVAHLPLPDEIRRAVPQIVDQYVFGAALNRIDDQRQRGFREQSARERERVEQGRRFYAEMVASGDYPYLAADQDAYALHAVTDAGLREDSFERGLRWLLDGIEAEIARHR